MKFFNITFIFFLLIQFTIAQHKYRHISIASSEKVEVSSYFVKDAEFVTAEFSIDNDDSDPIKRYKLIRKAKELVESKANENNYMALILQPVKLTTTRSKLVSVTGLHSSLKYRVLVSLSHFKNDFLRATAALREFVDSLPDIEDTEFELSRAELAIEDPEQYRQQIISLLVDETERMRKSFGKASTFEIDGLENPVKAIQLDDVKIALYINYKIKLEI